MVLGVPATLQLPTIGYSIPLKPGDVVGFQASRLLWRLERTRRPELVMIPMHVLISWTPAAGFQTTKSHSDKEPRSTNQSTNPGMASAPNTSGIHPSRLQIISQTAQSRPTTQAPPTSDAPDTSGIHPSRLQMINEHNQPQSVTQGPWGSASTTSGIHPSRFQMINQNTQSHLTADTPPSSGPTTSSGIHSSRLPMINFNTQSKPPDQAPSESEPHTIPVSVQKHQGVSAPDSGYPAALRDRAQNLVTSINDPTAPADSSTTTAVQGRPPDPWHFVPRRPTAVPEKSSHTLPPRPFMQSATSPPKPQPPHDPSAAGLPYGAASPIPLSSARAQADALRTTGTRHAWSLATSTSTLGAGPSINRDTAPAKDPSLSADQIQVLHKHYQTLRAASNPNLTTFSPTAIPSTLIRSPPKPPLQLARSSITARGPPSTTPPIAALPTTGDPSGLPGSPPNPASYTNSPTLDDDPWIEEFISINKDLYTRNDANEPLEPLLPYALVLLNALSGQSSDATFHISEPPIADWPMA